MERQTETKPEVAPDEVSSAREELSREAQSYNRSKLTITPEELLNTFEKFQDEVDTSGDGFGQGAGEYYKLKGASEREQLIMGAVGVFREDIEEQHDDELGDENSGVTEYDIRKLISEWNLDSNLFLLRKIDSFVSLPDWHRTNLSNGYDSHRQYKQYQWGRTGADIGGWTGLALATVAAAATDGFALPVVPFSYHGGRGIGYSIGRSAATMSVGSYSDYVNSRTEDLLVARDLAYNSKNHRVVAPIGEKREVIF